MSYDGEAFPDLHFLRSMKDYTFHRCIVLLKTGDIIGVSKLEGQYGSTSDVYCKDCAKVVLEELIDRNDIEFKFTSRW